MDIIEASYRRVRWNGKLTDAPTVTKRYGSTNFRPIWIEINYIFEHDKWDTFDVVISGPRIKKDGTEGETHIRSEYMGWMNNEIPQWILDIAHAYIPRSVQSHLLGEST